MALQVRWILPPRLCLDAEKFRNVSTDLICHGADRPAIEVPRQAESPLGLAMMTSYFGGRIRGSVRKGDAAWTTASYVYVKTRTVGAEFKINEVDTILKSPREMRERSPKPNVSKRRNDRLLQCSPHSVGTFRPVHVLRPLSVSAAIELEQHANLFRARARIDADRVALDAARLQHDAFRVFADGLARLHAAARVRAHAHCERLFVLPVVVEPERHAAAAIAACRRGSTARA